METLRQPSHVTAAAVRNGTTLHSPWHSPVPYLFGGLTAMLGLIAFALVILACSYGKLSRHLDGGDNTNGDPDLEAGEAKNGDEVQVFEDKYLVIMAGDLKPTFLATPMNSSSSCFDHHHHHANKTCSCTNDQIDNSELQKQTSTTTTTPEDEDHQSAADNYDDNQTH